RCAFGQECRGERAWLPIRRGILVGENAAEFARRVVELLRNKAACARLSENALARHALLAPPAQRSRRRSKGGHRSNTIRLRQTGTQSGAELHAVLSGKAYHC